MHASLVISLMVFGASIVPEPEITLVPLQDDLSSQNLIQDQEWRERVKRQPLPRVPTLDDRPLSQDNTRTTNGYRPTISPNNPYAPQSRAQVIPQAPTQADPNAAGGGYGQAGNYGQAGISTVPGSYGQAGNYGQGGGFGPTPQPGAGMGTGNPYGNTIQNHIPNANYNAPGNQSSPRISTDSNNPFVNANPTLGTLESRYGVAQTQSPYGAGSPSAGGNKPFNGYAPPSGYSAWNNLYLPTNNGTQNPYTNYVRPAMDQQQFNMHISEQINGVQTMERGYGPMNGVEVPIGGSGLANPNQFITYPAH